MSRVSLVTLGALGLLAGASVGGAQGTRTDVGLQAGVNLATITSDDASVSPGNQTRMNVGAVLTIARNSRFAIQPGLVFSQKGSSFTVAGTGGSGSGNITFGYIEVPVLAKFRLGNSSKKVVPTLSVGPELAFKAGSCKLSVSQGSISQSADCKDLDVDIKIGSTDFGMVFGAGIDAGQWSINAQYDLGLKDIDTTATDHVKNRTLSFGLGYRLTKSK
jgi:hypothetical protein